jgi:selenide,water dikinase
MLILTKPIGSGVILAGEMQGKSEALTCWPAGTRWRGLQGAAARGPGAGGACDDGCDGLRPGRSLVEHLRASGTGAALSLDAVPLLPGALALAERGVRSSCLPQNRAALEAVIAAADDPRAAFSSIRKRPGGSGG